MSAFCVGSQTLNDIANYALSIHWKTDLENYNLEPLKALGYDFSEVSGARKLLADMAALNERAYKHRYEERADCGPRPKFKEGNKAPLRLQVYKSLACLLYQCDEGEVSKEPLFVALEKLKRGVAQTILHDLPEWESCHWGN